MMVIRAALRQLHSRREGNDEGFSLMETLVAATLFGVFMTGVMLAVISMLQSTAKSQSLQDGQANLEKVFQKLDHQIRYADGIQQESTLGTTKFYVEWRTQATQQSPQTCTELRFDNVADTLAERSWQPSSPLTTTTAWQQLAKNITSPGQPFTWQASGPDSAGVQWDHQQVAVNLQTQFGGTKASRSVSSTSVASFTALNSSSSTTNVCQEVAHS